MADDIPADIVAENIRTLRKMRGYTVAELAERCARLGAKKLTVAAITNIELRRRGREVTVTELIIIADALIVSPGMLLPELVSEPVRYENVDGEDRDVIMDVILNNLEATKRYIESRRTQKTSAIRNPIIEIPGTGNKIQLPK